MSLTIACIYFKDTIGGWIGECSNQTMNLFAHQSSTARLADYIRIVCSISNKYFPLLFTGG